VSKIEELEGKIRKVVEAVSALKRENGQLRTERDSLKSHVAMLTTENNKAQRALADNDQLRKKQEQVTHRVERALTSLNALRSA
jgi:FtsZ-binding cell division protein ZapB